MQTDIIHILGISGSPVAGGNTDVVLEHAIRMAGEHDGVESRMISLAGKKIGDCTHCNWCLRKQSEGKPCVREDDMQEIYPEILKADALILASPVYIARLSGYMAAFLDRLRVFTHGSLYKDGLENKVGGAVAVGWYRHGGIESTLMSLLAGFMIFRMIPVGGGAGCPWGAPVLASEGGEGQFKKEVRHGVLNDEFGMNLVKNLVARTVSVAKKIKNR